MVLGECYSGPSALMVTIISITSHDMAQNGAFQQSHRIHSQIPKSHLEGMWHVILISIENPNTLNIYQTQSPSHESSFYSWINHVTNFSTKKEYQHIMATRESDLKWSFQPIHHKDAILKTPCRKDKVTVGASRRYLWRPIGGGEAGMMSWWYPAEGTICGGERFWKCIGDKSTTLRIHKKLCLESDKIQSRYDIHFCLWSLQKHRKVTPTIRRRPWTEWPSNKSLPV